MPSHQTHWLFACVSCRFALSCYLMNNEWCSLGDWIHPVNLAWNWEHSCYWPIFWLQTRRTVLAQSIITIRGWTDILVKLHQSGFEMSLRAKSHTDLQKTGRSSFDDSLYRSFSMSSSNLNKGSSFGNGVTEEVKGLSRSIRRPVRAVRPVSTISSNGSFLQINHLQGELVRKRKVRREKVESGGVLDQA